MILLQLAGNCFGIPQAMQRQNWCDEMKREWKVSSRWTFLAVSSVLTTTTTMEKHKWNRVIQINAKNKSRLKGITRENYWLFVWLSAIYSTIMAKLLSFTGSSIICRISFCISRWMALMVYMCLSFVQGKNTSFFFCCVGLVWRAH